MGSAFSNPVPRGLVALAVTDWYIDPLRGKDSNFGTDPAVPLKTFREYVRRCGVTRTLSHRLTFHLLNDIPNSDPMVAEFLLEPNLVDPSTSNPGGYIQVLGENLTVLARGTFTAVQPGSLALNIPYSVSDTSVDFTSLDKKLIRLTTGPRKGVGCAWTVKPATHDVQTSYFTYPADSLNNNTFNPSVGDGYEVVEQRHIGHVSLIARGDPPLGTAIFWTHIRLPSLVKGDRSNFACMDMQQGNQFTWCEFPWLVLAGVAGASGCSFTGVIALVQGTLIHYFGAYRTTFISNGGSLVFGGTSTLRTPGALSTGFTTATSFTQHSNSGGVELYDCATTFFVVSQGCYCELRGRMAGKNNVGPFAQVSGAGQLFIVLQPQGFSFQSNTNGNGAYNPGQYDFTLQAQTQAFGTDPANGNRAGAKIDLSYPKLNAAYPGGFGGSVCDPTSSTCIVTPL